jgi:tetratricopeptide (TPR) repeat protein/transcriptional regulator with XRE-family HTH domain
MLLSQLLRRHRQECGLSQASLASRAKISVETVGNLERGIYRTARAATARQLADALGLAGADRDEFMVAAATGHTSDHAPAADDSTTAHAAPRDVADQVSLSALAVRYSLPPATAVFAGRDTELDRITAAVAEATGASGVLTVCAIDGMPGVGKTALAVHAAYLLRVQFPDRQLFMNLHAHTPGRRPVSPKAALALLLSAVGVDVRSLPADLEGRIALWRDRIAGQRTLLVLDNAASSSQVIPLLPAGGGCLVLVTSRRRLADLPGAVTSVPVGVLSPDAAADMFARLAPRANADPPEAVAELVKLAGHLPLAVALLARVYARHTMWELAALVRETRASVLTITAEKADVASAFEVSYRGLSPVQQRFFRCLGLHPGSTIDPYTAAALGGIPLGEAVTCLDVLDREALLTETGHRRYVIHDLLRRYALDRAAADPEAERTRGLDRLLDYYQRTTAVTEAILTRQGRPQPSPVAHAAAPSAVVPDLPDRAAALWWARAEHANVLACLDYVTRAGQHGRVVALTAGTAAVLRQDGPWTDAITRHATAVAAARLIGDRLGMANALDDLGIVRRLTGDRAGAALAHEEALTIYRELGSRQGQANSLSHLGTVWTLTDDYQRAADALETALVFYRTLGDREGQADTLNHLGVVRRLTHDLRGAVKVLEEALGAYRVLGNKQGQATTLTYLGTILRRTGDYTGAAQAQQQALVIHRELGNKQGQANALCYLGTIHREIGQYVRAAEEQEQALDMYREIGSQLGQANAMSELGAVRRMVGDYLGAAQVQEGALGIYKAIRDLAGQAMSLCELGALHRQTEDVGRAEELLEQARGIFEELGDVADVLNELGTLHRVRGDLGRAEACHRQALKMARDVESQLDEARALAGLGLCALAAGHAADALAMLAEAHSIFGRMGVAETSAISALLNDIAETGTKEKRLTKGWDGRSGGRLPTISARGACEACRAPLTEVFASARAGSSASLATGS